MLPFNRFSVFAFLQTSLNTNNGIARDSDTQDTLLISKVYVKKKEKKDHLLSFDHTELLETKIRRVFNFYIKNMKVKTTVLVNICVVSRLKL